MKAETNRMTHQRVIPLRRNEEGCKPKIYSGVGASTASDALTARGLLLWWLCRVGKAFRGLKGYRATPPGGAERRT